MSKFLNMSYSVLYHMIPTSSWNTFHSLLPVLLQPYWYPFSSSYMPYFSFLQGHCLKLVGIKICCATESPITLSYIREFIPVLHKSWSRVSRDVSARTHDPSILIHHTWPQPHCASLTEEQDGKEGKAEEANGTCTLSFNVPGSCHICFLYQHHLFKIQMDGHAWM